MPHLQKFFDFLKPKMAWGKFQRTIFTVPMREAGAILGVFIWVGQSKAKQILRKSKGVVYVGIMGMTRAVWVGQERVWVGHGLPSLIARTGSGAKQQVSAVWGTGYNPEKIDCEIPHSGALSIRREDIPRRDTGESLLRRPKSWESSPLPWFPVPTPLDGSQ